MSIRTMLQRRLVVALKERDVAAVAGCRTALAAIANAEAVPLSSAPAAGAIEQSATGVGATDVPRRVLSEHAMRERVGAEVSELRHALTLLPDGQDGRRARLRLEIEVLESVLGGA